MSPLFLLLSVISLAFCADITVDFDCAAFDPAQSKFAYIKTATVCKDKLSLAGCKQQFGGNADTTVTESGVEQRPFQCFGTAATGPIDPTVKKSAIQSCPAFCGYCCKTDAYNCKDKDFPRINCELVDDTLCEDITWRQIIAEDCPSKCGFCNQGGCIDIAPNCDIDNKSICTTIGAEAFVNENCKRTCDRCSSTPVTTTTPPVTPGGDPCASVKDNSASCATWNQNGFCVSGFYTDAQKKQYCAK
ncbi:hypothetical protein WR25_23425 [Diploscapter pachys]|uniref:ShKT domain-containing protein n=1 Tax=Diploscapter pachys TaxID=2018661 RepID=A0A2A2JM78_9BILA|nr:hypothetical protein WR25_23425 [Diploscapter pachys]